MDKLFLVFYVGVKNFSSEEIGITLEEIKKEALKLTSAEDIIFFVLPSYEIECGSIKIDCINPKYVNKSVYDLIKDKVEKIEKDFNNFLKTI